VKRGKKCPDCKEVNDSGASFCVWCGTNISDVTIGDHPEEETTRRNIDNSFPGTPVTYVSRYKTAIFVSNLVSFFGWVLVAMGVLFAVIGLYSSLSMIGMLPDLGTAVSGLFLVMGGQITKATVDNADHTREILQRLPER